MTPRSMTPQEHAGSTYKGQATVRKGKDGLFYAKSEHFESSAATPQDAITGVSRLELDRKAEQLARRARNGR